MAGGGGGACFADVLHLAFDGDWAEFSFSEGFRFVVLGCRADRPHGVGRGVAAADAIRPRESRQRVIGFSTCSLPVVLRFRVGTWLEGGQKLSGGQKAPSGYRRRGGGSGEQPAGRSEVAGGPRPCWGGCSHRASMALILTTMPPGSPTTLRGGRRHKAHLVAPAGRVVWPDCPRPVIVGWSCCQAGVAVGRQGGLPWLYWEASGHCDPAAGTPARVTAANTTARADPSKAPQAQETPKNAAAPNGAKGDKAPARPRTEKELQEAATRADATRAEWLLITGLTAQGMSRSDIAKKAGVPYSRVTFVLWHKQYGLAGIPGMPEYTKEAKAEAQKRYLADVEARKQAKAAG